MFKLAIYLTILAVIAVLKVLYQDFISPAIKEIKNFYKFTAGGFFILYYCYLEFKKLDQNKLSLYFYNIGVKLLKSYEI